MASDRQVIEFLSPAQLAALMNASGIITVRDTVLSDGKPVIHAALKVVNAETGEQLPGGLPFSVVMFKAPNEQGYSNIAIGTIVPASELRVALPRDYFNFCNQRFRFTRVFPVDDGSFVIQMDLILKNATREYIKFSFGLWGALYSQVLFELMGRGRESLITAAEAYARVHTDFATQIAASPQTALVEPASVEAVAIEAAAIEPALDVAAEPVAETVMALEAEAILPAEPEEVALDAEAPQAEEFEVAVYEIAPEPVAALDDVPAEPVPDETVPVEEASVDVAEDVALEDAPQAAALVADDLPPHLEEVAEAELGLEPEPDVIAPEAPAELVVASEDPAPLPANEDEVPAEAAAKDVVPA